MNELAKLVIVLFVVTGIATCLISAVHSVTKPLIDRSRNTLFQNEIREIFPASDSTRQVGDLLEVYSGQNIIGYAQQTEAKGYSSTISILVGVDTEGKVQGVVVLQQQETPGLGTRITEKGFLDQFKGKSSEEIALRKSGGQIDAITSATISSRSVVQAVKTTVQQLQSK